MTQSAEDTPPPADEPPERAPEKPTPAQDYDDILAIAVAYLLLEDS